MNKNVLFVLSNISKTAQGFKTGIWLDEFAIPYMKIKNEGYKITLASPNGGLVTIDEKSVPKVVDSKKDFVCEILENTEKLSDLDYESFDAVIIPGGHAVMFDLVENIDVSKLLSFAFYENKIIAAICHATSVLISAKTKDNKPIIEGKDVTGFSNEEEKLSDFEENLPFSIENKMKELKAVYSCGKPFVSYVIEDGNLITAQNSQSSEDFANAIVEKLKEI